MELNAAVIGCGRMGAQKSERLTGIVPSGWLPISHAECIRSASGLILKALAEKDEFRLREAADSYGVTELYTDYQDMLDKQSLDIVSIATRTPMKAVIIRQAILAGVKGIYVEKPIANCLSTTLDLLALAAENNCFLSYGVNRRFHYAYRKAKTMLDNKELGELREVSVEFGRSPLLWAHPHSMDLLTYFAGRAVKIRADLNPESFNRVSELHIDSDPLIESAQVVFESGVRGSINLGDGCNVRLLCSEGVITLHGDGAYIQVSSKTEVGSPYFHDQKFMHFQPAKGATQVAFAELSQVVNRSMEANAFFELISPNDIINGQKLLFGCVWSHMNDNKLVYIDDTPTNLFVSGRAGEFFA